MVRNAFRLTATALTATAILEGTGSDGAAGSTIVPGWGGYLDVPPEPQDASDPPLECNNTTQPDPQSDPQRRCAVPGSELCVEQCASIGAYCVHKAMHPRSPSSGVGDLYWCKGGFPTWTCSYQYSNGDNCHWIYPLGTKLCLYQGGK